MEAGVDASDAHKWALLETLDKYPRTKANRLHIGGYFPQAAKEVGLLERGEWGEVLQRLAEDNFIEGQKIQDPFPVANLRITALGRSALQMRATSNERYNPSKEASVEQRDVEEVVVFIGHGGESKEWRELKDYIDNRRAIRCRSIYYESVPTAGVVTKDRVEEMLREADMAFLVMSKADEQAPVAEGETPRMRARQNVIHEAGLFQGTLGWERAILVVENGVESFSNNAGIGEIRYVGGQISGCFGEVADVLEREFGPDAPQKAASPAAEDSAVVVNSADVALFQEFRELWSSTSDTSFFLRDHDFGNSFEIGLTHPLETFSRGWDNAERTFHDTVLDQQREELRSLTEDFFRDMAVSTGPVHGSTNYQSVVPKEMLQDGMPLPQHRAAIKRLNGKATALYKAHQAFVTLARSRLEQ